MGTLASAIPFEIMSAVSRWPSGLSCTPAARMPNAAAAPRNVFRFLWPSFHLHGHSAEPGLSSSASSRVSCGDSSEGFKTGVHDRMRQAFASLLFLAMTAGLAAAGPGEPPQRLEADMGDGVKIELVLIPAGTFKMGSGESAEDTADFFNKTYRNLFPADGGGGLEANFFKHEHPQHEVSITKPFFMGVFPVTRGQFRQFVAATGYTTELEKGETPGAWGWNFNTKGFGFNETYSWRNAGYQQTDDHPVVNVTWNDAVAFCRWLSEKEGTTYRLPSEAEWEYAYRAGTTTRYPTGDDPESLGPASDRADPADAAARARIPDARYMIRHEDNYVFTSPVGSSKPNPFGLFDMQGNAFEWCADWYGENYYAESPRDDPTGPATGTTRVMRGGTWNFRPLAARSAERNWTTPDSRNASNGFRIVRDR